MSLSVSLVAVVVGATGLASPELRYFPGPYFDSEAKITLQRRAMEVWPGPSQLLVRWRAGQLEGREKIAVLVGAAASHDPALLPLYREAIGSRNQRMRMAAVYGYRDLLGDGTPDVAGGIDDESARALAAEMDAVIRTLRVRPLVEFWLQAVLATEGKSMPGWEGIVFRRPSATSLRAVERVMVFDDFRYLAIAFRESENRSNRAAILRLIEAVTLKKFFVQPSGPRIGWGTKDMDEALDAADAFVNYWLEIRCETDPTRILPVSVADMGVRGVHPLATNSYYLWTQILLRGTNQWRMMTARRLYEFGGPWPRLTVFQAHSEDGIKEWEKLLEWYGLEPSQARDRATP
jgi:hypothetical protein